MEQKDSERNVSTWLGMANLISSPIHCPRVQSQSQSSHVNPNWFPPSAYWAPSKECATTHYSPQWPKRAVQLRTWPASARELQMNVSGIGMDRVTIKRRSHIGGYFIPICSVVLCPLSLKQSHWITAEEEQKVDVALYCYIWDLEKRLYGESPGQGTEIVLILGLRSRLMSHSSFHGTNFPVPHRWLLSLVVRR